ncbi:MAG: hypothetical protein P8N43_00135 [Alphaproteobacteria bacterium]|nr:hypothetical protein [Alphaproteobacteria bacterium]
MSLMVKKRLHTVAQLDPMSKALLPVLRYFYLTLKVPASHGWRHGFDCAIGTWGQERGLVIANATQKFMYDLIRCAQSTLYFCDPLDISIRNTVARDEKVVLSLLTCMRQDQTGKARDIIAILLQGRIDPVFVRNALELAAKLDGATTRGRNRKLKIVK